MIGISLQITFLKRLHYMFALYFIKSFNEEEKLFVKHIKSRNNLHIYLTFVIIFREKKRKILLCSLKQNHKQCPFEESVQSEY